MYPDIIYISSIWWQTASEALTCKAGVQGIEFHCVFPLHISNTEAAVHGREKGAGSEASHLRPCDNMAQDVLPWQLSTTDPLMGCLVCQCDIC